MKERVEESSLLGNEADGEESEGDGEREGVKVWSGEQDLQLVKAAGEVWQGFWGEVAKRLEGDKGVVWKAGECERRFDEL